MNFILGFLLLGCSFMANADNGLSLNVDAKKSDFIVALDANPTTGFQWSVVHYDKKLLTLTNSSYQRPQTNLIGAGGQMLFTFTLNKGKAYPKKSAMSFKYSRPWEHNNSGTMKEVMINFYK
jgi:inhibitor of cysteine peptidase